MFKLLALGILLATNLSLYAESDWELKKDKDGIKVYTRDVEGSSFKEFKGVTVIDNVTITQVLDVIFDVKNYDKLFPDLSGQKVIEQKGKYHNIHYSVLHTPWPVSDRDDVNEMDTKISDDGNSAFVSVNVRKGLVDEKKGLVRISEGKGFWKLTKEGNGVKVVYQYHGNPGGSIPAWLANSFVVSHPFETLENLHKRLKR